MVAQTYDIRSGITVTIINLDWTVIPSYCQTLTYYLYVWGTTTLADPIFVLNGAKYDISTTDVTKTGSYPLDLYAEVTGFPSIS